MIPRLGILAKYNQRMLNSSLRYKVSHVSGKTLRLQTVTKMFDKDQVCAGDMAEVY